MLLKLHFAEAGGASSVNKQVEGATEGLRKKTGIEQENRSRVRGRKKKNGATVLNRSRVSKVKTAEEAQRSKEAKMAKIVVTGKLFHGSIGAAGGGGDRFVS